MIIVCATDDNFVQHCTVMLTSLLLNNDECIVYVLTEGITKKNEDIIRTQVTELNGEARFCVVDPTIVEKFPMPEDSILSHISRATYYRLLIPEILPEYIDKVIYLDCDIIVNSSLIELWNTNVDNYALAAVPQIGSGFEAERLGYPIEYGYFNAGVNVINMQYWRENSISKSLIDYISDNYHKIKYHDQDALNAVLYDKTLHLLPQWNMTSLVYGYFLDKRGDKHNGQLINNYTAEKDNVKKNRKNPPIIHFVSKPKPWQSGCVHPLSTLYYDYARKTNCFCYIKQENILARYFAIIKYWGRCHLSYCKQLIYHTDKTRI